MGQPTKAPSGGRGRAIALIPDSCHFGLKASKNIHHGDTESTENSIFSLIFLRLLRVSVVNHLVFLDAVKTIQNPKSKIQNGPPRCKCVRPEGRGWFCRLIIFLCLLPLGCDRPAPTPTAHAKPTVASLVPAATDLIVAMGARDQLVAVSNYDRDRPDVRQLPKVGDYLTTDWERLAQVRPDLMIVQLDPDRMPPGLQQRAKGLDIRLINVRIHRLDDIFETWKRLGEAMNDPRQADAAVETVRRQLSAVQSHHAGRPPVRTLLVLDTDAQAVVGHDNFLNDLLTLAGGVNVVPENMGPWPSIDQEMLVKLRPDVIIQLLPDASPQVLRQAAKVWERLKQIPAVRSNHVTILQQWFLLQPGAHVGDIAELLNQAIAAAPVP